MLKANSSFLFTGKYLDTDLWVEIVLKKNLQILSSIEWNVTVTIIPLFEIRLLDFDKAIINSLISLLTKILNAWKILVALFFFVNFFLDEFIKLTRPSVSILLIPLSLIIFLAINFAFLSSPKYLNICSKSSAWSLLITSWAENLLWPIFIFNLPLWLKDRPFDLSLIWLYEKPKSNIIPSIFFGNLMLSISLNFLLWNSNLFLNFCLNLIATFVDSESLSKAITLVFGNSNIFFVYPPWPKVQSIKVPPFWGEIILNTSLSNTG